jgi:hypothetical protein
MSLENLDRHYWKFDEAMDYVATLAGAEKINAEKKVVEPAYANPPWGPAPNPAERARAIARNELLVALRDGDLHATGRLSTVRANNAAPPYAEWTLHSGHQEPISPAQWRSGEFRLGQLRLFDGEFIDVRLPRFMVRAIWPPMKAPSMPYDVEYSTPYLDLLRAAIQEFRISEDYQPKKDNLVDWFRAQEVEGEPVSENLASAMATLIRLPASQRGGAKRIRF